MKNNIYLACGAMALAFAACADDNSVVGTSTEPNTMALGSSSSSDDVQLSSGGEISSSSVIESSSSSLGSGLGNLWNPGAEGFALDVARYVALLPKNAKPDGRWFLETDSLDGGKSSIVWPVDYVSVRDEQTIIKACNGICGTAVLDKGTWVYDPFAGVGFTLAKDDAENPVPVDVSNWGGVCISYTSEAAPTLELDLGDSVDALFGYGMPAVALPKTNTPEGETKCYKWSDFKFPSWVNMYNPSEDWKNKTGEMAAKQLVAVKFRISAPTGRYEFNIKSLGTYSNQTSNPASSSSALPGVSSSSSPETAMHDLWEAYEEKVNVARYADDSWKNVAHGGWFAYTDGADFSWDDFMAPDDYHDGYLITTMERSDGFLQTEVSMDDANLGYEPIALFGFKLAQDGGDTIQMNEKTIQVIPNYIPVDISNWGGLCVTYNSTVPISMEIGLGSAYNDSLGYNYTFGPGVMPSVALPVQTDDAAACFKWADFKQTNLSRVADGDKFKISGEDAAKRAGEIVFRVTAKVGLSGEFTIKALGTNRN